MGVKVEIKFKCEFLTNTGLQNQISPTEIITYFSFKFHQRETANKMHNRCASHMHEYDINLKTGTNPFYMKTWKDET